jgi:two-component system nitrogen regulation sensor histidine kinase NtrY
MRLRSAYNVGLRAVASSTPIRPDDRLPRRKWIIIPVAAGVVLLIGILFALTSLDLPVKPDSNQQLWFFASLAVLIFVLFLVLTFILVRNVLKLFAERRLGVLGSKFRTRLVVGSLLLSFLPVIGMFFFAYVLMNRSIDKWFSTPVEEVRQDTATMASLLSQYAAQNALSEAVSIAAEPEVQRALGAGNFAAVADLLRRHESTLQGGFAVVMDEGEAKTSFGTPGDWASLKNKLPERFLQSNVPLPFAWENTEYILGSAPVGEHDVILVAMPLPKKFSETVRQIDASSAIWN